MCVANSRTAGSIFARSIRSLNWRCAALSVPLDSRVISWAWGERSEDRVAGLAPRARRPQQLEGGQPRRCPEQTGRRRANRLSYSGRHVVAAQRFCNAEHDQRLELEQPLSCPIRQFKQRPIQTEGLRSEKVQRAGVARRASSGPCWSGRAPSPWFRRPPCGVRSTAAGPPASARRADPRVRCRAACRPPAPGALTPPRPCRRRISGEGLR